MNVVDTATSTTQQSVAARMPIPPADSAVADTPRGQALTAIAGGAPDEFASGPAHALPNVSGRPAATVPMPESVAPHAAPSRFRPGAYVAVFLPAVPDGNDVEVADGLIVSDGQVAAPDAALAGAEVVRQLVLAGDLTAQIMAVGDGRYVAYSGPYDTEQQAQAACAHFGPALRCVPARPAGRNESRIRGVRAVL
jgi:hypothetical protein